MNPTPSDAQQRAILARLERFSRFTDNSIGLPFTRFRIGVEPLIGLIPGIGDLAGLAMSGYVLLEAQRAGVSSKVKRQMLRNIGIDFIGGLVPVFGDAFDAVFKANMRNTRLLRDYLNQQLAVEPAPCAFPWKIWIGVSLLFAVVLGGAAVIL
ncbi:MAG: DUF4112 domain-containing protein [Gammaproteobacteria bacterium]|nr:DUF4112 domain-containing protein [Gammaproteobacteria bacterium]